MTNRKIRVSTNQTYSTIQNLHSGIPQGLFLIAFNSLADIIEKHRDLKFTAYADDFNILIDLTRSKSVRLNLDSLFSEISNWCSISGASLSLEKCNHLHICRKTNCQCEIETSFCPIKTSKEITILGLTLNSKYRWNSHINRSKITVQAFQHY